MQRLQSDNHLRGRAVGVRNDHLLFVAVHSLRVHFWHNQRHVGIITIKRRIIDDDAARSGGLGGIFLCRFRAYGKQSHIPAGEIEGI